MNRITLAAGAAIAAAGLLCTAAASAAPATGPDPASANARNPATAAADADAPREVVKYADLNIGTDDGAHILYRRIVGAARNVCVAPESLNLRATAAVHACRDAAVAAAVRQVNSTKLAAEFAARSKSG